MEPSCEKDRRGKTEMEFGQRRLIAAHDMTDDMGCTDL